MNHTAPQTPLSVTKIPASGTEKAELLKKMAALRQDDARWQEGKTWSLVYHLDEDHTQLLKDAHNLFFSENYLNPMAFPSIKRMESEVVRMTASLLHGDESAVGAMTSGGTESIFLAVYAARERARKRKPWLRKPEMIVPASIHVAFGKAAHYLGIRLISTPLKADFTADPAAMARRISSRTILLAASAPQYPHGVLDPIAEIGQLAARHQLPFHVDSCIGGFMLPWLEQQGYPVAPFDFRVPGVTSISADVHKFGYAAKGASVLVYRNMDYFRHQFYIATEWPGGIYAATTFTGTRSGGPIAAAWAAINHLGVAGYQQHAQEIMQHAQHYQEGIRAIPELMILGHPAMSIVAYTTRDKQLNIYAIADQMEAKGWTVDRQQKPNCIHTTLMAKHIPLYPQYLKDLRAAVETVKAHPELARSGTAAMYGMMAKVPFRGMVRKSIRKIMEGMYGPDGEMPDLEHMNAKNTPEAGETDTPAKRGWWAQARRSWWNRLRGK